MCISTGGLKKIYDILLSCMHTIRTWAFAPSFLRGSCTDRKDFGLQEKSNTNKIVKNKTNRTRELVCALVRVYTRAWVCMCVRVRARSYTLEAKIITCTCLLFLYFFPRNMARRCTVFILCFCARLMCRDMRSYRTRGDNRAGAPGRPRVPVSPPESTVPHTDSARFPRAGMTEPPNVPMSALCVCVSLRCLRPFLYTHTHTHTYLIYIYTFDVCISRCLMFVCMYIYV